MANPVLTDDDGEHDYGVTNFRWLFSVGAAGALTVVRAQGMKSFVRNSAGNYTFTLDGTYIGGLMSYEGNIYGTHSTTDGTDMRCVTDSSASATPTINFVWYNIGTAVASDPKSGNNIFIEFQCKNSNVGP